MDSATRTAILDKASGGIQDLINWAQQTPAGKLLPKTTNWTFEACRVELELGDAGTFDDVIRLYKTPDDAVAALHFVHVDSSHVLFPLEAPGMDIALRWGLFRAPLPFMRDRSATYIEYTKEFTDRHGRRGFARYIRSHALGHMDSRFVHTEIRSWGVVIVETNDPSVLHVSSTVDIDWNGSMPTWMAAKMTSRRAQAIKQLAHVLRVSKKLAHKRCGICRAKPSFLSRGSRLASCGDCTKVVCSDCRSAHTHAPGVTSCWVCVSTKTKLIELRLQSKSAVTRDDDDDESILCAHKSPPARYSQAGDWCPNERDTATDTLDPTERIAILKKASGGIQDLINWAQQTPAGKLLPKTTNWTFEACRVELELGDAGTFDDVIRLYETPGDEAACANCVHVDKSQVLFPIEADGMNISLRLGIFRAPLPFMRDRSATYIEYTKEFTDRNGRRGFARYIRSHALGAMHTCYVRANIRSWGVVIVETNDPNVLHVSSTVDIDWNGNMAAWVATMMTSRRAQAIKSIPTVLRQSKKTATKRCGICLAKPGFFGGALSECEECERMVCSGCRAMHNNAATGATCWGCIRGKSSVFVREDGKSFVRVEAPPSPQSCNHKTQGHLADKMGWASPQNHHHAKEALVDLSYLPRAKKPSA
ncbi:hypothetical protein ACHHYP_10288 [Achlya hypogyna]|uniref:START domain-containing protein n=1 Tax=Achlya hypogyna TaxID=1202772 RepID=A0A1V9YLW7_ACHHY|nr:hypothetical protein ACHHYP_10288 [Achlya hypogyna]